MLFLTPHREIWMQWSSRKGADISVPLCHSNGLRWGGQRGWGQILCPGSLLAWAGRLLALLRPARCHRGSCCAGAGGPAWRSWSSSSPRWDGWGSWAPGGGTGPPCSNGSVWGATVWTLARGWAVQPLGLRTGLAGRVPKGRRWLWRGCCTVVSCFFLPWI